MEATPAVRSGAVPSRLGLSMRGLVGGAPGSKPGESIRGTLRLALSLGYRVFDVSAGSATAAAQERIGALGLGADESPFVLSPIPSDAVRAPRELLARELAAARLRLGGHPVDLLLLRSSMLGRAELRASLEDCHEGGLLRHWGVALPPGPSARDDAENALSHGARFLRIPFNLLDRSPGEEVLELAHAAGAIAFVTDPHAHGLLDGSLLQSGPPGPGRPFDGAAVARSFAPVRELAYLTADRKRTLPQAAIQYVLGTPGIGCALVDVAGPETLAALAQALDLPRIDPELLRRLPPSREPPAEPATPRGPAPLAGG